MAQTCRTPELFSFQCFRANLFQQILHPYRCSLVLGFLLMHQAAWFIFRAAHSPLAAQRCKGTRTLEGLKVGKLGDTADFPGEMRTHHGVFPRSRRSGAVLQ